MKCHEGFDDWDPKKAKTNWKNHGIKFEIAAEVLADEQAEVFYLEEYDDAHSMKEDRYTTLASHPMERALVLKIVWTYRWRAGRRITRITSARRTTRRERDLYEKAISKRE